VIAMDLFSSTFNVLERALDYSALRQKVISENIANADTPNYKAKQVNFRSFFQQELRNAFEGRRTDPRHIPIRSSTSNPVQQTSNPFQYNHNGNSVDMDEEMSKLAENQIYYYALADRLSGKFNGLETVIKGGK
jgi:flagellar basal-body rod protein FlgB